MSTMTWTDPPKGLLLPSTGNAAADGTGSPYLDVATATTGDIQGVDPLDQPTIRRLFDVWTDRYPRNLIRTRYVLAKEEFKDFGISIPRKIRTNVEAMIGWPAKAVRALADLSSFEGFAFDGMDDTYDVKGIAEDNALDVTVPQTVTSCYTHGCSFLTIGIAPESTNAEPRVEIQPRSADWSAALWDRRRRRIEAALTITDDDEHGRITGFTVWLPGRVYVCDGTVLPWRARRIDLNYPGITVVPFVYDPQLNRPFGRSRVSRSLMSLTDIGFRTIVRMEASAEFYAVPKLWFLGADADAFSQDTWSSLVSAINSISKDEDGDVPKLQQVTQSSMQPHSDMLRTIALLVASETNLPVNDLGITMDNPASAEAMAAAERKLTREADRQNRMFARSLKDAMRIAVCLRDNLTEAPDELDGMRAVWAPTKEVSTTSRADAFSKMAGVQPAFAETEVGWRYAGFGQDDVDQIMTAIRAQKARSVLDQLTNGGQNGTTGTDAGTQRDQQPGTGAAGGVGAGQAGAGAGVAGDTGSQAGAAA